LCGWSGVIGHFLSARGLTVIVRLSGNPSRSNFSLAVVLRLENRNRDLPFVVHISAMLAIPDRFFDPMIINLSEI